MSEEVQDVQSLNTGEDVHYSLETMQELWADFLARGGRNSEYAFTIRRAMLHMSADDYMRFERGKRSKLRQASYRCGSRSGAYEMHKAVFLAGALIDLGLVKDDASGKWLVDAATGKRVTTRIRELARLKWDWENEEARAWLRENWPNAVSLPLDALKRWVRNNNSDARSADDKRVSIHVKVDWEVKTAAQDFAEVFGQTLSEFVNRALWLRIKQLCEEDDD